MVTMTLNASRISPDGTPGAIGLSEEPQTEEKEDKTCYSTD
jgi:hypothetical protein